MKFQSNRVFSILVIGSVILFAAGSCKKSSSGGGSAGVSATVSGTAWGSSLPVTGIFFASGSVFEIGAIQFKGGDSTIVALGFNGPVTLNKPFSSDSTTLDIAYQDIKSQVQYDGVSGSGRSILTITSYDSVNHKIAGTFTGVLYNDFGGGDSLVVTNGHFNVGFVAQ